MRRALVFLWVASLAGPAGAGEILLINGSRIEGDLASDVLLLSTGSGLVEVPPDQVLVLTRDEIRLKDGRVVRGTLVGTHVKTRTALGELAIKPEELQAFRATGAEVLVRPTRAALPTPPKAESSPVVTSPSAAGSPGTGDVSGIDPALTSGLPALALYQGSLADPVRVPPAADGASSAMPGASGSSEAAAATHPAPQAVAAVAPATVHPTVPDSGRRLEVIAGESALYRDAFGGAPRVGRVVRGDQVSYVDFIDRRLRILNTLVFDGGHWLKVRLADGMEGWLPADVVREIR